MSGAYGDLLDFPVDIEVWPTGTQQQLAIVLIVAHLVAALVVALILALAMSRGGAATEQAASASGADRCGPARPACFTTLEWQRLQSLTWRYRFGTLTEWPEIRPGQQGTSRGPGGDR